MSEDFPFVKDDKDNYIYNFDPKTEIKIQDLKKLSEYLEQIKEMVQDDIFLGIKTSKELTKLDRSV